MADCFWTDTVACAEDCGAGPSVFGGVLGQLASNASPFVLFDDEGNPVDITTATFTGHLYYAGSGDGCEWQNNAAALNGETLGSTVFVESTSNTYTWTDQATMVAVASDTGGGSIAMSGQACTLGDEGLTGNQWWALGSVGGSTPPFMLLGTFTDTVTGNQYKASGVYQTCF